MILLGLLGLGLLSCTPGDSMLPFPREEQTGSGEAPAGRIDPYYLVGTKAQQENLTDLYALLYGTVDPGEAQFSIIQEIANEYAKEKEYGRLINFLSAWTHYHPEDPYTAYYLLMIAYAYIQEEAYEVASLYFSIIVNNYPDLIVRGESIHYIALNQLITLIKDQEQLVWYYEELISRFPDKIDTGVTNFMLAQAYEQIGEWDNAIKAYNKFLPYYGTIIPRFPDAYAYAKQLVDFYDSRKDWTFESLNSLVTAIKITLDSGNSARLWSYRAKVNFFAHSWGQDGEDNYGVNEFNIVEFMRGNRIYYSPELDASSNANEAYLRTSGWFQGITIWYFYFRKIYFPPDPEVHGRWEWAGVYFGEKF